MAAAVGDTGLVASTNTITAVIIALAVALGGFLGIRMTRRWFHFDNASPERERRARKLTLLISGYVGLLFLLGLIVWGATGNVLAGVSISVAVMFISPFILQLVRHRFARRISEMKAHEHRSNTK